MATLTSLISDTVRQFEREIALLWDVYALLREKGLALHLSRSVLQRPVCITAGNKSVNHTVLDIIGKLDQGLANFLWERIGAWSLASIGEEFDGVRVFFAGKDISDFGPAHPAVSCYLNASNPHRLFSSATSTTYSANALNFSIHEKHKAEPVYVTVTNLSKKNEVITDLGGTVPCLTVFMCHA